MLLEGENSYGDTTGHDGLHFTTNAQHKISKKSVKTSVT